MKLTILKLSIALLALTANVISNEEEPHRNRVVEKKLSDQEHYIDSEHNPAYDHEAFLGEEAKKFRDLEPLESARRLGNLVDKIDSNSDGFVTKEELKDWLNYVQARYLIKDAERQWVWHNPKNKENITWEEYSKPLTALMQNYDPSLAEHDPQYSMENLQRRQKRERRRWTKADKNGDDALTRQEFGDFIHPQEAEHMMDVVLAETFEDIDKDGDGKISLKEYISDMYREEGDQSPDWVKNEQQLFSSHRDMNGDGYMDVNELRHWIFPPNYDSAQAEVRHLIHLVDKNDDEKLSKEEILDKYDVFVGSRATDYGKALISRDEF